MPYPTTPIYERIGVEVLLDEDFDANAGDADDADITIDSDVLVTPSEGRAVTLFVSALDADDSPLEGVVAQPFRVDEDDRAWPLRPPEPTDEHGSVTFEFGYRIPKVKVRITPGDTAGHVRVEGSRG